jgi:hypothetical protein
MLRALPSLSLGVLLVPALLAACSAPQPQPEPIVRKAEEVTAVRIHSLPPGCFVELNNEFMGVTPLTIRVPSHRGTWDGRPYGWHTLRVSIPRGRGHDQRTWRTGDPVPRRVVLRVPGAETWYHANSPKPPATPTGVNLGP